jgi:hypothetical protein
MWKVNPNDNTMQTSYQYLDSVDDMTKPVFSISVMGTVKGWGYGVQHHCQHYFSFIVAVSFNRLVLITGRVILLSSRGLDRMVVGFFNYL